MSRVPAGGLPGGGAACRQFRDGSVEGPVSVSVSAAGLTDTVQVTFRAVPVVASATLAASADAVIADGEDAFTLTLRVRGVPGSAFRITGARETAARDD